MSDKFPEPPANARLIFRQELNSFPDGRVLPVPSLSANEEGYRWLSKFFDHLATKLSSSHSEVHLHFGTDEEPFDSTYSDVVEFRFGNIVKDDDGKVNGWMSPTNRKHECASMRYLELANEAKQLKCI